MANNSLSLVSLDFDTLKSTLKGYLSAQPQFTDYNFDGSNMSVLLDILTYNTHMNAFYLNMVASEMFLDSAQLRNSVVSKAKELNYLPRSYVSSMAELNCRFAQSGLTVFVIPAGTRFSGRNSNSTYSFTTSSSVSVYPSGGYFTINNLPVYEGRLLTDAFVVDNTVDNQRFVLNNDTIDSDSIAVNVIENNGQTNTMFQLATNLYGLQANSTVYFVQAVENAKYEIVFGDGVFGRLPQNGATVQVQYRTTSGTDGNGSTNFTLNTNLGSFNGYNSAIVPTITTIAAASGGANAESIDSIRFNAPRHYQTQDRAITVNDYINIVLENFPKIKACHAFGGETVTSSVEYGTVFICPVTYSGYPLSTLEKEEIVAFLSNKCSIQLVPKVMDPDYLYMIINSTVTYNPSATTYSPSDIQNIVSTAITQYNSDYLTNFNTTFKMSRFEAAINDSDTSISSNQTKLSLRKNAILTLNDLSYIKILFRNKVIPGSIYTSVFTSATKNYIYTDVNPNNNTFRLTQYDGAVIKNNTNTMYLKDVTNPGYETYVNAGTVNYDTGEINLVGITVSGYISGSALEFFATPVNQDVSVIGNDVIEIDQLAGVNITVNTI